MSDKRLRGVKKSDLLEMLLEVERENESLVKENQALVGHSTTLAHPTRFESSVLLAELERHRRRAQVARVTRNMLISLLGVAASTVLAATLFFPTLRIYGSSMAPTLEEGEVVVTVAHADYSAGDIVAFYYNNKLLVKRVICGPGDWFSMQEDGAVIVNGDLLDEPYVQEDSFAPCDLELPYQVPDGCYFVMGDHRSSSVDSRSKQMGCIDGEQIVGRIVLCVWPLNSFGGIA